MPELYTFLCNMVGMGTDVAILQYPNMDLVCTHSKYANVKDDVPESFWSNPVWSVGVSGEYPNQLVVYIM